MVYRRNSFNYRDKNAPTKVYLHWSMSSGSYSLKYEDTRHFGEMMAVNSIIKTFPWGEWEYDLQTKVWYFAEKYLNKVKDALDVMHQAGIFDVDFQDKPTGQTNFATFVPVEVYLKKFATLTGVDISKQEHKQAKREYFKACMRLHPDHGGSDRDMTELNESWYHIETSHFKINKEMSQYA